MPDDLMKEIIAARDLSRHHSKAMRDADELLSSLLMKKHGIVKDMIVKDKDTGNSYRVDFAYGHDNLTLSLRGHRIYPNRPNGRRKEAISSSHISLTRCEIVSVPDVPPL